MSLALLVSPRSHVMAQDSIHSGEIMKLSSLEVDSQIASKPPEPGKPINKQSPLDFPDLNDEKAEDAYLNEGGYQATPMQPFYADRPTGLLGTAPSPASTQTHRSHGVFVHI